MTPARVRGPRHPGQLAIAGDSPYSYVLDADRRVVVAKLDTPGDTSGLMWSEDGRYLVVGDDAGRLVYFDGGARWGLAGEARVGGAAKRMWSRFSSRGTTTASQRPRMGAWRSSCRGISPCVRPGFGRAG